MSGAPPEPAARAAPAGAARARAAAAALALLALDHGLAAAGVGLLPRGAAALAVATVLALGAGLGWRLEPGRPRVALAVVARTALAVSAAGAVAAALALVLVRAGLLPAEVEPPRLGGTEPLRRWLLHAVVLAPLVEELVHRGLVLPRLVDAVGGRAAVLLSGVFFWTVHQASFGRVTAPHTLVGGWLLARARLRSGGLLAPVLLHALGNLALLGLDRLVAANAEALGRVLGAG